MVWATSDTERPVPRYLFTCLQFTAPANPGPAVPSNSATPITSVPSFIPEPPCACAQPLDVRSRRPWNTNGSIATRRQQGKLRQNPFLGWTPGADSAYIEVMGLRVAVMVMLAMAGPALAAAPTIDRIDVVGD